MERSPVQTTTRLVGLGFLAVAILGFVPGVTTDLYDGLEFAGREGSAELLGLFEVSVLHNIVHGLFGIAGLAMAATASGARTYLLGGGALYLGLFLLGVVGAGAWIPTNRPDDWLHLGLGGGMIALALLSTRSGRSDATAPS